MTEPHQVDPGGVPVAIQALGAQASRRRWLVGTVAATAVLAGWGLNKWLKPPSTGTGGGKPAIWNLDFEVPGKSPLQMKAFAGRPLLLNFWATWCPPCIEELPLLDHFFRENSVNGWQVLGLAVDQASAVSAFLQQTPLQFPIAIAGMTGIELSKTLGNLSGGLPFTVVLGSTGEILHRKMGRVSPQDLQAWALLR